MRGSPLEVPWRMTYLRRLPAVCWRSWRMTEDAPLDKGRPLDEGKTRQ